MMIMLAQKIGQNAPLRQYLPDRPGVMGAMNGRWSGVPQILGFITWLLIVLTLIAFIRWLWYKGDEARERPRIKK